MGLPEEQEDDFVFFGTPIETEEGLSSRKKKAVAESSGQLRSLPSWKQEVRDEEGRRRFHGAFTGGFSAGYYNTVGSKEGWAPQTFTSSRKNRAEVKQQSILNFLDDDEKSELEGRSLSTSSRFDTFGFTAAEHARKQAEKEQQNRHSAIPGPIPDEIVLPISESIGVKLLKKMGWRQGHTIKDSHPQSIHDVHREARKAFLALATEEAKDDVLDSQPLKVDHENIIALPEEEKIRSSESTPVYILNPKQDLHGLGYDPYTHAPEFRAKKHMHATSGGREYGYSGSRRDQLLDLKRKSSAPGFGIGALEELDVEDEDVYASGFDFETSVVEEVEEASRPSLDMPDKPRLTGKDNGVIHGFRLASNSDFMSQRFHPPEIPKDFVPLHKFSQPIEANLALYDPPPPEVPPPDDSYVKLLIDGLATLVARSGKLFEDLSREKHQDNPLFGFLNGGNFHEYYARKIWEVKQKDNHAKPQLERKSQSTKNMSADHRGRILGESPLGRSKTVVSSLDVDIKFPTTLVDTFTKPTVDANLLDVEKPFKNDPSKQERFEQFLREKYHGGLRSTESGLASNLTESARARERLDFEAAAEAIEKGQSGEAKYVSSTSSSGLQFTSAGVEGTSVQDENLIKNAYPKREEFPWRPLPILCKRFDLVDPYMGKPPPAPRIRSKTDALFFLPNFEAVKKTDESAGLIKMDLTTTPENKQANEKEPEIEVEAVDVERPVDLYKAIFSDDSEEEVDHSISIAEDPEKKEHAASATLNRLMAGDFLESLGKELGLVVPVDQPVLPNIARTSGQRGGITNADAGDNETQGLTDNKSVEQSVEINGRGVPKDSRIAADYREDGPPSSLEMEIIRKGSQRGKKYNNDSPEQERRREGSDRRHYSSNSDTDVSSDYHDRSHSSSRKKRRDRESSESRRHRSRKHSKRRKNSDRESTERSSHRTREKK